MNPILLEPARGATLAWAREQVALHHYLHRPPDPRSRPFGYVVRLMGLLCGCLFFGRPESSCCYQGGLTYGSLGDVRAAYDRWEVLNLARVWLSPDVQAGGRLCTDQVLPGYLDRRGHFRSTLASTVVRLALTRIGHDYLSQHPPCFLDQPYTIRAVLSYCNTHLHRGTLYQAAGFRLARTNAHGIQTWWTPDVGPLTPDQDAAIRCLAELHPRSVRLRNRDRNLFVYW